MRFKNILLVDDDEDDREIFLAALEKVKLPVSCAVSFNGRDALDSLKSADLSPDLIFLDLNMPLMDGHQFLREIKKEEELKHIPIVVLSTSSNPVTIFQTKELGAFRFISKPERFDEMIGHLQQILGE